MTDFNNPNIKKDIIKKILDERRLRKKGVIILDDHRSIKKGENNV